MQACASWSLGFEVMWFLQGNPRHHHHRHLITESTLEITALRKAQPHGAQRVPFNSLGSNGEWTGDHGRYWEDVGVHRKGRGSDEIGS